MKPINTEIIAYPSQDNAYVLMVVLTQGTIGETKSAQDPEAPPTDLAAYAGIVNLPAALSQRQYEIAKRSTSTWVMSHGAKLSLREAQAHFPNLTEADYRR